jgi:hypothetical protein
MQIKNRYKLLEIFWVVTALNLMVLIIGILVIKLLQLPQTKDTYSQILTSKYLLKESISIIFQTAYFYLSLNYYNRLMVERKKATKYIQVAVICFVISYAYFFFMHKQFPEVPNEQIEKGTRESIYLFSFSVSAFFFAGISLLLAYLNNLRDEKKTTQNFRSAKAATGG